jgi:hypothetical protein
MLVLCFWFGYTICVQIEPVLLCLVFPSRSPELTIDHLVASVVEALVQYMASVTVKREPNKPS